MSFLGAKSGSGVYQAIINLMPPHDTYIEPFLGSGAVMQRKPMSKRSIGIDIDNETLKSFWCSYPIDTLKTDSLKWLDNYKHEDRTVIYCDPPYLESTRTSRARYRYEMTAEDHERLLEILMMKTCHVMISGYRSDLYDQMLSDWWSIDFQSMTRGGVRTETVWCNFEPGKIHYHTYAGKDFTDRQRIKRKAERWAKKFENLPIYERQAVLSALLDIES